MTAVVRPWFGEIARLRYGISRRFAAPTGATVRGMRVLRQQFAVLLFGLTAVCAIAAYVTPNYYWYPDDRGWDILPIVAGFGLFFGAWHWLRTGRAGPEGRQYAETLPLAMAIPVLIVPIVRYGHIGEDLIAGILVGVAMVPIGRQFASQIADPSLRRLAQLAVLAFVSLACVEGLGISRNPYGGDGGFSVLWVFTLAAISLVPGLIEFESRRAIDGGTEGPLVLSDLFDELTPIVSPAVACLTLLDTTTYFLAPLILWLLLLVGRRIGVERLTTALGRTTLQRDLVVTATERERARIAADIHDYALQDLTMLVRRLDSAGDVENATAARDVADRLRAICGDLRLPILDDLGVGPAIDWLCGRVDPEFGEVTLEREGDEPRLPADAELAFFRVAQEALNNAVRHGAAPVRVRYRAGGTWAELEVDDRGPGVQAGAAEAAERTGHLGLMNMNQRAEAIDAELTIGRRPGGGTRVRLVWEGAAEPTRGAAEAAGPTTAERAAEPT
jgi:signal transduction histidine kinase